MISTDKHNFNAPEISDYIVDSIEKYAENINKINELIWQLSMWFIVFIKGQCKLE